MCARRGSFRGIRGGWCSGFHIEALGAKQCGANTGTKRIHSVQIGYSCAPVFEKLAALGRADILVIVGGVIPPQDYDFLYKSGAAAIFGPGTVIPTAAITLLEMRGGGLYLEADHRIEPL